jgi:hypothetical protein
LAATLVLAGCASQRPYSIAEVRQAFVAEGIPLDPPDFSARGQEIDGARIRAELFYDEELDIYVFEDVDAYERVKDDLADVGAGPVYGMRNIVVVGPVRGHAPRVERALARLP